MTYNKPTEIQVEEGTEVLMRSALTLLSGLEGLPAVLREDIEDEIYDFDWEAEYLKQHYAGYEEACENEADQARCECD